MGESYQRASSSLPLPEPIDLCALVHSTRGTICTRHTRKILRGRQQRCTVSSLGSLYHALLAVLAASASPMSDTHKSHHRTDQQISSPSPANAGMSASSSQRMQPMHNTVQSRTAQLLRSHSLYTVTAFSVLMRRVKTDVRDRGKHLPVNAVQSGLVYAEPSFATGHSSKGKHHGRTSAAGVHRHPQPLCGCASTLLALLAHHTRTRSFILCLPLCTKHVVGHPGGRTQMRYPRTLPDPPRKHHGILMRSHLIPNRGHAHERHPHLK